MSASPFAVAQSASADPPPPPAPGSAVISREAAELEYHARVLAGAANPDLPLLDRVRFCSFFTSLTDEFFRIRMARLHDDVANGKNATTRRALISRLHARFGELMRWQRSLWENDLRPALSAEGIVVRDYADATTAERDIARGIFDAEIFPLLTPLAVGPTHPFPFLSDLSLSFSVTLDTADGGCGVARVKVPTSINRLICVSAKGEDSVWVRAEEVIAAHMGTLFAGRTVMGAHLFLVTRDADYALEDPDIDDLVSTLESELHDQQFGDVVRLEVAAGTPDDVIDMLHSNLGVDETHTFTTNGPPDLSVVGELDRTGRTDLMAPRRTPRTLPTLGTPEVFAGLRSRDILVHHPYDSFAESTSAFINMAADDPRVLAIKQTLYRTSGDSPIVHAMMRAVENGKQACVLVELKARFDEENNITWAGKLGAAGVHVVHGFVDKKTHTKTAVVVRRDEDGVVRRYGHVATGNYNSKTAKFYEDLGVFTADPVITADLGNLFNMLTGQSPGLRPDKLVIAPTTLKERLLEQIAAQAHEGGRVRIKTNHLTHPEIIAALLAAGRAGAKIDAIVRTTASLVGGVEDVSENIAVRSLNGPILEHSRIYAFGAEPDEGGYLIGSADLMPRNLDNRVEALIPITDAGYRAYLDRVLEELWADEKWSWTMNPDATWTKVNGDRDAQAYVAALNPREFSATS